MESESYSITEWIVMIVFVAVFVVAIFLNSLILHILRRKQMKTTTFKFIANQTVSEILYCVISLTTNWFCWASLVQSSSLFSVLCVLLNTMRDSTLVVSTFSMTVIAYERYRKLYQPLSSELNTKLWIAIIWILSISLSMMGSVNKSNLLVFGKKDLFSCKVIFKIDSLSFFTHGYSIFIVITICNIIPLIITAYFYYKVIRNIRQRKLIGRTVAETRDVQLKKNKRKTTEMLIALTALYFIVSLPIYCILLFKILFRSMEFYNRCTENFKIPIEAYVFFGLFFLGIILINPFIILYYNSDFKNEAFMILKLNKFVKSRDTELQTFETVSS